MMIPVANFAALPKSGADPNALYITGDTLQLWVWRANRWQRPIAATAASAPTILSAGVEDSQEFGRNVFVRFTPPTSNGGHFVQGYNYYFNGRLALAWPAQPNHFDPRGVVMFGSSYRNLPGQTVEMAAVNNGGEGPRSNAVVISNRFA